MSAVGKWLWAASGFRLRDLVVVLTLFSHLMATFGFPLPTSSHKKPTAGVAYPCQARPCGCPTSEHCWSGDCCCFTIEEKLAWAEANGVEPPEHVRPLVESRRSHPVSPKQKSCGSVAQAEQSPTTKPTCCAKRQAATASCCSGQSVCEIELATECARCSKNANSSCCEKEAPTPDTQSIRWVVGLFAQKCRGEGPAGFLNIDPTVLSELTPIHLCEPQRGDAAPRRSDRLVSLTHSPPTPPPRIS
jgi:hypothetical protein